jgi:dihydrofolate reductase
MTLRAERFIMFTIDGAVTLTAKVDAVRACSACYFYKLNSVHGTTRHMPVQSADEPALALIAAVAENRVIGRDTQLPWRLSTDLKRFKAVTWGKPVIMGRRTFLSIGRPLPGRTTVVVTRDRGFAAEGVLVAHDLDDALDKAEAAAAQMRASEIMVAGGAELYAQTLDLADRLYLTTVHAQPEGDALFPAIDEKEWRVILTDRLRASDRDEYATTYRVLDRLEDDDDAG